MSDFMLWIHANYIQPQINAAEKGDYSFHFDLVQNALPLSVHPSMEKRLEFAAVHAFFLGLRTGAGLSVSLPPQ